MSESIKVKVYVLKDLPGKCPYCNNSLSDYSFGVSRTKNVGGKYCSFCNKYFLTVRKYNHYSKIFKCMNLQEANPLIQELKEKQQEKHEKKLEKNLLEKQLKDNAINLIDQKIKAANLNEAPSWNAIKSFSREALESTVVAYLVNVNFNRTLKTAKWYFVTSSGRMFKKCSDKVYLYGSESMMGRTMLENCSGGEKQVSIFNDIYYINAVIIFKEQRYIQLTSANGKNGIEKKEIKESKNQTVYVYFRLNNKCILENHNIETVTAQTINVKTGLSVDVNVFYCKDCKKYFINYDALKAYVSMGIYPALQFSLVEYDATHLKAASELMLYGYNVREGCLSESERHKILSWIIDSGLLTKGEIIKDLQFKVNYNGKKQGNENAKKKWETDLNFVSHYVTGNVRRIQAIFKRK